MRLIPLSQGLHAKIDDDFYPQIEGLKFYAARTKGLVYARNWKGYLHQMVLGKPSSKRQMIVFKDGDGLNCQRENLEYKERSKNTQEHSKTQKTRNKSSSFLGVSLRPERWRAHLKHNGKTELIGEFKTELEAARAYNKRALEVFGKDAKINQL